MWWVDSIPPWSDLSMRCLCVLFLPSELSCFHFPFGDFSTNACKSGCGVMVDSESDVSNCLSIVDFEV